MDNDPLMISADPFLMVIFHRYVQLRDHRKDLTEPLIDSIDHFWG
jgi:hypothetical protein